MSEERIDLQGRRIEEPESVWNVKEGDYWKDKDGNWFVCCPNGNGNLSQVAGPNQKNPWTVVEHEDGTITVTPSLHLIGHWHGYLTKWFFKSC